MKKVFFLLCMLFVFCGNAGALDTTLINTRDKIFEESREIKNMMAKSRDIILLNSMWDSCLITISQIDAYLHMIGIFNCIKSNEVTEDSLYFLSNWLGEIKKTDDLNIKSLESLSSPVEPTTKAHITKLKDYFSELNDRINTELNKISSINKTAKKKKK